MEQTLECWVGGGAAALREREGVVLRVVGQWDDPRIPASLRDKVRQLEQEAQQQHENLLDQDTLTVCIAVNYGGRADLVQATQRIAQLVSTGQLALDDITEDTLAQHLSTHGIFPDPDLIVRTSGETRLSNFLLWNAAYAEIYFTDELWPDFGPESLMTALDWFAQRQRRFGGRQQQLHNDDE